jgi:hypothetical protein
MLTRKMVSDEMSIVFETLYGFNFKILCRPSDKISKIISQILLLITNGDCLLRCYQEVVRDSDISLSIGSKVIGSDKKISDFDHTSNCSFSLGGAERRPVFFCLIDFKAINDRYVARSYRST